MGEGPEGGYASENEEAPRLGETGVDTADEPPPLEEAEAELEAATAAAAPQPHDTAP